VSSVPFSLQQRALDSNRWPAAVLSASGEIVAVNAEWTRHHAQAVGASYFEQVADAELTRQLRLLLAGEVASVEHSMKSQLGAYLACAAPLGDGVLVFHEPLAAEVAGPTLVHAAFDSDPVVRYLLRPDGVMLAVNRSARETVQRLFGRVMRAGDSMWPMLQPSTKSFVEEGMKHALAGKSFSHEWEVSLPAAPARWYRFDFEPVRDDKTGQIIAVQLATPDITERKRADEARVAVESARVLQHFADHIPAMLAYWDRELRCHFANEAYQVWFARSPAEVMRLTLPELLGPTLYALNKPYIDGALRGEPQRFERELKDPRSNVIRYSQATYTPDVENGEVKGFFVLVTDVTERRNLEAELRQSQKMEAVGQLASGVAHDFNNLLTVVLSSAQVALSSLPADSEVTQDLREILEAGNRAATLTRQLLAFGRRDFVSPQVVELAPLVTRLGSMFRRVVRENIRIELSPGEAGRVRADPAQIEQILMNLVVNAQDAMPTGGVLHIESGWKEIGRIDPLLPPGRYATLTVKDSGMGMDDATMRRIFEPFFTTKPVGRGTGLGLSTVYSIARQAGGAVRVQSAPAQGASFTVLLPQIDAPMQAQASSPTTALARGTETILLVEDEPSILKMSSRVLAAAGYQVLSAHTGEEALRVLKETQGPIDLLLTDMVMPGLSGSEVAHRVLAERPGTRVVFASGYTDDVSLRQGVESGEAHLLAKPYTAQALRERVREVLDLKR